MTHHAIEGRMALYSAEANATALEKLRQDAAEMQKHAQRVSRTDGKAKSKADGMSMNAIAARYWAARKSKTGAHK